MATSDEEPKVLVIYRPFITLRDGRRIYARDYGRKAFAIPAKEEKAAGK